MNGVIVFVQGSRAASHGETLVWSLKGQHFLIITQASSGLEKLHMPKFCKYRYLYVKVGSLATVKSCVTVGHFHGWQIFCPNPLTMD